MTDACHKVFVYGTLKKGQPNEYFMRVIESVEYLGVAETCTKYPLIIGGKWNLPMLLNLEEKGKIVKGELYSVNDGALKRLDQFEGHPDFYERKEIDVKVIKDSEISTVKCWTYFIKDYTDDDLNRDYVSQYDSSSSHGLAYDTRENFATYMDPDQPVNQENEDHPTQS